MSTSRTPSNVGKMENADGKSIVGSPACGDMVALYIKVDEATKVITDIKFESYGCASNIATASIITELAKGKTLEEAKKISWKDAADALGGLPKIKIALFRAGGGGAARGDHQLRGEARAGHGEGADDRGDRPAPPEDRDEPA